MLCLSRKPGEVIQVADNIQIVVTRVRGNRVTLGIRAPRDVRVRRGELDSGSNDNNLAVPKCENRG